MLSWPASAADLLTCDFLVSWRSIARRRNEITRDPSRKSPRFGGITGPGIQIRHAGWLPDDVAPVDEEVDAGHE
jgi:hypothetical protein